MKRQRRTILTSKYCIGCERTRPVALFSRNRTMADGLQVYCKDCNAVDRALAKGGEEPSGQVKYRAPNHGQSKTHLYKVWKGMRARCSDPKAQNYRWYGAKGVYVCTEWDVDFLAFKAWSEVNGYEPGMQIDRRDSDGPYSPDNCRWVTRVVNLRNRSLYLSEETEQALTQRAAELNISKAALITRAVEAYLGVSEYEGG